MSLDDPVLDVLDEVSSDGIHLIAGILLTVTTAFDLVSPDRFDSVFGTDLFIKAATCLPAVRDL